MKNNPIVIAMTLALLASAAACAQTVHLQTVVPFDFNVGKLQFPAGKYDIRSENPTSHVLYIRNMTSGKGSFVVPQSCESAHPSSHTRLTFHRYGQTYFMAEVWVAGYAQGHQLGVSPTEAEVAKQYSKKETTLLAAKK